MTTRIINRGSFIREQRLFPQEPQALSVEIDRMYVDVAAKLNDKTIGLFAQNSSVISGERWQINGQIYQGFRQFYSLTGAGNLPHGLTISNLYAFTKIYGTFTDGSIWYPLPYVDATAANNQISLTVTSTNIVITAGGGSPPSISSGFVVLEWLTVT